MSKETEITYELTHSFKYTPKGSGDQVKAQFIQLNEPSVKNLEYCGILKQSFMRVIAEQNNIEGPDEEGELSTEDETEDDTPMPQRIINSMYTSGTDITKVFMAAKELFRQVALVDGEKALTLPMLDEMSITDLELMTGLYMSNFILASVLGDQ